MDSVIAEDPLLDCELLAVDDTVPDDEPDADRLEEGGALAEEDADAESDSNALAVSVDD